MRRTRGRVSLVGAGPGDPELITLKGARRLAEADVVYCDALIPSSVLSLCAPAARVVPVGKRRSCVTIRQEDIHSALIRDARAGLAVVRLKGGDPFVFGRGGEEALALLRANVPFEIIPGVTSGTAVPAVAGIPVTHRGLSSSVAFVTAHDLSRQGDGAALRRRLRNLARGADTLVLFMAGAELDRAEECLLGAGLDPSTPAAVIESGTLPAQRVAVGRLDGLAALGADRGGGPVLAVVGGTVALSERIAGAREGAPPAESALDEADPPFDAGAGRAGGRRGLIAGEAGGRRRTGA